MNARRRLVAVALGIGLGGPGALCGQERSDVALQVLRGRVFDSAFEPLPGARIAVREAGDPADPRTPTAALLADPAAVSAADGAFEVRVPFAGPASLVIAAAGSATVEVPVSTAPGGSTSIDVALPAGGTLVGSVRDAGGVLLAGVEVVAEDALREVRPLAGLVRSPREPRVVGRTDARGLFRLDGVLRTAASLRFFAPGFEDLRLGPHALGEPLVVELRPVEMLRGRILDADGRPTVATVRLLVDDGGHAPRPVRSAADGAFAIGVPVAVRAFRVVAAADVDGVEQKVEHGPIDGPRDGLVLTLGRPDPGLAAGGATVRIAAVDSATGRPPATLRAAVAWGASGPGRIAELALRQVAGQLVDGAAGSVDLPLPERASTGALLVGAPGYAWTRVEGFAPPGVGGDRLTVVELSREAVLRGRVVDPVDGRGVSGARVGWLPHSGGRMRHTKTADRLRFALEPTTTGADGEFELRGVPAGLLELLVDAPGRPPIEAVEIEVDEAAELDGLEIVAPHGRTQRGKLTGLGAAPGYRVVARPLAADPGVFVRVTERVSDLAADGSFELDGLGPGFYVLDLLVPREPRGGAELRIPVEPFRVRGDADPASLRVDVARDLPGRIGGRVTVVGGALSRSRLAVVAEDEARQLYVNPGYAFGSLGLPGADGRFGCALRQGSYRLRVFDVATGVELGRREGVRVVAGRDLDLDLAVEVVPLEVRIARSTADAPRRAARVEILVEWPPARSGTNVVQKGSSNDTGVGISLQDGVVPVALFVPPWPTTLRLWGHVGGGEAKEDRKGGPPLAEFELTPDGVGRRAEVELVEAVVDDPDRGGGGGGGGGDADVRK